MSTLALGLVGTTAPATEPKAKSSLWSRLVKAREAQAARTVRAHLAGMDDARLLHVGFSEDDIWALRAGGSGLPRNQQGK